MGDDQLNVQFLQGAPDLGLGLVVPFELFGHAGRAVDDAVAGFVGIPPSGCPWRTNHCVRACRLVALVSVATKRMRRGR